MAAHILNYNSQTLRLDKDIIGSLNVYDSFAILYER
jgi:hypothetical protein